MEKLSFVSILKNIFNTKVYLFTLLFVVIISTLIHIVLFNAIIPAFKQQLVDNSIDNTRRLAYRISQEISYNNLSPEEIANSIILDLNSFKIFKVHYISKSGKILYSTQKEKINTFHKEEHFYDIVSKGNSFHKVIYNKEHKHEKYSLHRDIIEFYIPIIKDDSFHSAFELYYDITDEINAFRFLTSKIKNIIIISDITLFILVAIILLNASRDNLKLKLNQKKLRTQAHSDSLTKLYNRRYFYTVANNLLKVSKRTNKPISLCMLDIDNFKLINDTYGHHLGDIVIKNLAKSLQRIVRDSDIIARYGGEEFIVLFPNTDIDGAEIITNKICKLISDERITYQKEIINYTVSIGVSEYKTFDKIDDFIIKTDNALYKAKHNGKNQVVRG